MLNDDGAIFKREKVIASDRINIGIITKDGASGVGSGFNVNMPDFGVIGGV